MRYQVIIPMVTAQTWLIQADTPEEAKRLVSEGAGELVAAATVEPGDALGQDEWRTERMAECDNCEAEWPESQLHPPQDLWERLDPGSVVPAGECPECGSLCYLIK